MMPNLLFGDNQFFGINHMSEEKARAQALAPESGARGAAFRSGVSLAGKDISGLTRLLIDSEVKMFKGLRTPLYFPAKCCGRSPVRP
jgi:hypothetical protein